MRGVHHRSLDRVQDCFRPRAKDRLTFPTRTQPGPERTHERQRTKRSSEEIAPATPDPELRWSPEPKSEFPFTADSSQDTIDPPPAPYSPRPIPPRPMQRRRIFPRPTPSRSSKVGPRPRLRRRPSLRRSGSRPRRGPRRRRHPPRATRASAASSPLILATACYRDALRRGHLRRLYGGSAYHDHRRDRGEWQHLGRADGEPDSVQDIVRVVDMVNPSVVTIDTTGTTSTGRRSRSSPAPARASSSARTGSS